MIYPLGGGIGFLPARVVLGSISLYLAPFNFLK